METTPYTIDEKQQRIRVIVITAAFAVIVLGIAAWAIIAIINGSQTNKITSESNSSATVAVDDAATAPETEGVSTTTAPAESTASAESNTSTKSTASTSATSTTTSSTPASTPETGPEELLPVALVAGLGTAYLSSRKLAKRELPVEH